jgi:threonine 3-dehydrogenase
VTGSLFAPSSIAAFGDKCPKQDVPEDPPLLPRSMYGVTKVYNELLGLYYHRKFGLDFRCIRYPGIISSEEYEYHGTTDYSTEIFFMALRHKKYTCYLKAETPLPLIHMDDALQATLQYLETDSTKLTRSVYNLAGLSLTPKNFADEIQKYIPSL